MLAALLVILVVGDLLEEVQIAAPWRPGNVSFDLTQDLVVERIGTVPGALVVVYVIPVKK